MKIIVTGGSGLVGKHVVNFLSQQNKVSVLDIKEPASPHPFYWVDIMNLPAVAKTFSHGFDAVVHMAGIPHPLNDPPEKVFAVNVVGTFNVLEAAAHTGIKKLIFASSESVLGFAFSTNPRSPQYIPIDEKHPLAPQDPYGLSKLLGEEICRSYSLRHGMKTVCLRAPWIWVPEEKEVEMYRSLVREYSKGSKNLLAYIHVEDYASAIQAALETEELSSHEVFFITADENWTGKDSRELLREYYLEVRKIASDFGGRQSLISNKRAKTKLGFTPKHTWREFIDVSEQ